MDYRTILVHADLSPQAPVRVRLAARLARAQRAHLVGVAASGLSCYLPPSVLAQAGPAVAARCQRLREDAGQALALFAALAREEGVASVEQRLAEDDAEGALAVHARDSDLVVVGQPAPESVATPGDLAGHLLLHGGRPVLVVPPGGGVLQGAGVLLAWDGSEGAGRAMDGALPLLCAAPRVTILSVGPRLQAAGESLAAELRRQGLAAAAMHRPAGEDVGAILLDAAAAVGAGLLAMGGYGHLRLRERVLGGVTATVLRAMAIPVLLAHGGVSLRAGPTRGRW